MIRTISIISAVLLSLASASASAQQVYSNQGAAYQACMENAQLNYEVRIASSDAKQYRCVKVGLNSYTGEIWLRNCRDTCPYYWSHGYGSMQWPLAPTPPPPRAIGPCECPSEIDNAVGVTLRTSDLLHDAGIVSRLRAADSEQNFRGAQAS